MTHEVALLSPEKTILTYRVAGLGSRVLAHMLDVFLLLVLLFLSTASLASLSFIDSGFSDALSQLLWTLGPFVYFIVLEGLWNGQTLGKKAVGIRVRLVDGTPVTFAAALGRNLLRPADLLPGSYLVGLIAVFTNSRSQRIGDLVAGTMVLHEGRPPALFSVAPHRAGVHAFEDRVGELRGMTPEEYAALKRLCDRFPELPGPVQEKLLREVWAPVAQRRGIPHFANVHPIQLAEAAVMRYGRTHGLL